MKKWILTGFLLMAGVAGCEETERREKWTDVKERYFEEMKEQLNETKISSYIDSDIILEGAEANTQKHNTYIDLTLYANLNEKFKALSDEQKYELFEELYRSDYDWEDPNCGTGNSCEVDKIHFSNGKNDYEVDGLNFANISVDKDGDFFKPKSDPVVVTSTGTDEWAVYEYMKTQYDLLTDYGANYVPEKHDPLVARMAAEKFGITADEAGDIYIRKEMGQ
ncbi:hypothetical protein IMZ31_20115 (plasmid) [Pontibacillus sp. ALD_SL1]|uniref:hypothetical protein n=1 Tax=Pontibacillus sp. ALD_SL1 TaxID=2777185 RepID=UPI001A96BDEE|nr:hypothetical protein [Pontibacillus sp. ALD_SL1]QST02857.1 hypothetical protein IMZ31_20115 [Pontibacillus sp. ALD_SL1]